MFCKPVWMLFQEIELIQGSKKLLFLFCIEVPYKIDKLLKMSSLIQADFHLGVMYLHIAFVFPTAKGLQSTAYNVLLWLGKLRIFLLE